VTTRKVKAITEELCGHSFSASAISAINKGLDEALTKFARRKLGEDYPYLILDARYEKVREEGVIESQAVLVAISHSFSAHSTAKELGSDVDPTTVAAGAELAIPPRARSSPAAPVQSRC